jgi:protein-arginine kinase activator protein McsA
MSYDKFQNNLIRLFKIFEKRPNHLSQFLIENDAFNEDFKKNVIKSENLNSINELSESLIDFSDFDEMNEFLNDLIKKHKKNKIVSESKMNKELFKLISEEKFEDAAALRDYMKKNQIKITF